MVMRIWSSIKNDFDIMAIVLIPVAIAINLSIGQIITVLKIPIFLDSIGTVLAAVLAGPWVAAVAGVLTVFAAGVTVNPILPWYSGTAIAIGLFSGFVAKKGFFRRWILVVLGGILMGFIAAVVSAPVTAYLFGGVTAAGSTLIVAYLEATGRTLFRSVFFAGLASDPLDKMLTYIIVAFIFRNLPRRFLLRFPRAAGSIKPR